MEFQLEYLSFFVIQVEGKGEQADKRYKHYQTMNEEEYENSSLKVKSGSFRRDLKRSR